MSRFEKWMLWTSFAITAITGIGLLWTKYLMHTDDPWAVINHPLQPWLLKAHIVAAPALVFALGLISSKHIWQHFKARVPAGRRTGITTLVMGTLMILSGYLIQVVTLAAPLKVLAIAHITLGFAFLVGFVAHQALVASRAPSRAKQKLRISNQVGHIEQLEQ
jgi:hypothetical protein